MCYLIRSFWENHLPVGMWIGILAVIGVAVPYFRDNVTKQEKAFWTAAMLTLLLLEVKSIYQDQKENQEKFEKTISEFTGGNSYIYFSIPNIFPPFEIGVYGIAKGNISATANPNFVGEFPLRDVVVATFCQGWLPPVNYGVYYPNEQGRPREDITLQFPPTVGQETDCSFFINGSNGSYSQRFHFLFQDGTWRWGSILTKYGNDNFRHEYFGPGFPKDFKWN